MENLKIMSSLIELTPGSMFNKRPFIKKIVNGTALIFVLNYVILNAIPNIEEGQARLYSLLILFPNIIFAAVAIVPIALKVEKENIRLKKNDLSIKFFWVALAILSVCSSYVLYWAAGCNSASCDIREGADYLVRLLFAYSVTLAVVSLSSYLIIRLLYKLF